tara:strand:+ start:333 stop:983 length:651 start_codon:yes stop_codon:yes gene_type:complete
MKFTPIYLGQSILKYEVPLDIFYAINNIYEHNIKKLVPANKQLIGKIKNEHSLFYNGINEAKVKRHNFLPLNIVKWFLKCYGHYLKFNNIYDYKTKLNSVWINEMKEHEYNPAHTHSGDFNTGLSSVMILKLPNTFGEEYSALDTPQNGKLQMFGSSSGQFAKIDHEPPMQLRDFYIFPYDMRHAVYPFNGTKQTRRTLAANCDVDTITAKNKGVK